MTIYHKHSVFLTPNSLTAQKYAEQIKAQLERCKGKWTYGENDGQDGWFCSECGFFVPWYYDFYGLDNIDFIAEYHTCPKCDTKMMEYTGMRGEQDG